MVGGDGQVDGLPRGQVIIQGGGVLQLPLLVKFTLLIWAFAVFRGIRPLLSRHPVCFSRRVLWVQVKAATGSNQWREWNNHFEKLPTYDNGKRADKFATIC